MIGRIFDRKYRVERLLGKGGMGEVYEAVHVILDRKVALKVMHAELVEDKVATERFLREALAASEIGHANIVDVLDVGVEDDGAVFIVMELLEGKTLDDLLEEKGSLHPALATKIILSALTGLHAAHRKGVVHRDLKPENVVISLDSHGREVIKLLDFGIAVFQKHETDKDDMSLTAPGRLVGTPNYLSPEQIRGKKEIDARVDVWAAGVMLYEMLTGQLPFDGDSYNEVLSKILLEEPKPMQQIQPRVPDQLVEIVDKALTKNRHDRYQNAGEFIGDLYLLQGPTSTSPDPVSSVSGSYAKVQTGDYERRSSYPGSWTGESTGPTAVSDSDSWAGDRRAITADIETPSGSHPSAEASVPTGDPEESTPMVWRDREAGGGRRFGPGFFVASGVAVAAVIGIVAVLVAGIGQDEPTPAPELPAPAPEVAEQPPPPPEPEPEPEPEPVKEEPKKAALVTVTLEGMPPEARAFLDGEPVEPEFERPRSRKPYVLTVEAPGYEPFEKAVVLRRDLTVVVGMTKKANRATYRDGEGEEPGAPAEQEEKQSDESLVGNPFGG
jgi:serine/threonine-protein kinase